MMISLLKISSDKQCYLRDDHVQSSITIDLNLAKEKWVSFKGAQNYFSE